ncbi:11698_t:CDS:2 [Entrophospora sp. SA101]|nr:11698_t:CDS:2 [Entrophospora sp. SA101]
METPIRSPSSSPTPNHLLDDDDELTPEQSAHLNEIDFNTGLDGFLLAALKSPKDRLFLLKLDQEMERFIIDENRSRLEFPPMNSYQRLIIHRVAQYFKLSHVVDTSGKAVVLYKSIETQIPILRFSDLLEQEDDEKPEKSVKIMRRQQQRSINPNDPDNNNCEAGERKILSIEEREAAYLKARARIFKDLDQPNVMNGQLEENNEDSIVLNSSCIKDNTMLPHDIHPNHFISSPYMKHMNQYRAPSPYVQSHAPTFSNSNHIINPSISTQPGGGIPHPMMGFPPQQTSLQLQPHPANIGAIRPPKSTELFDPNNPPPQSSLSSTVASPLSTGFIVNSSNTNSSRSATPQISSSLLNKFTSNWVGDQVGNKVGTNIPNMTILSQNTNSNNNHSLPYEGIKPNQANEQPPKPSHILELYDFAVSDNLTGITLTNATIKRIDNSPKMNDGSNKRQPTVLAIFKNSKEASKMIQTFKSPRFKLKAWEPLPKNTNNNDSDSNLSSSGNGNDDNDNSTIPVS